MLTYHSLGKVPHKRHTAFRKEDGGIYYEELIGNKGFSGPSALLYHVNRPTAVTRFEFVKDATIEADPNPALRMRHFFGARAKPGGSPVFDRVPVLFNADVTLSLAGPDKTDDFFYRNGQADELIYVSDGSGVVESLLGELRYRKGDYVCVPRGILHRYRPDKGLTRFFIIEATGHIRHPKRYRNEFGQLLEHSPYCERDFRKPEVLPVHDEQGDFTVVVKQHNRFTRYTMDHHPFDVVGWDGYFYPWAFNIEDFEPIVGRVHQPPPVHQTFEADNFVVCSFVPRLYDFHPEAVPAPYHHSNVDSDEVIYYAKDKFMSRKGIEYGSITLHPDGLPHGPHPGRAEASIGQKETDELAVMVDTFRPLKIARPALEFEDREYYRSWV